MIRAFLRSAIHNATVTRAEATWPVALRVDPVLIRAAEILPLESVEVVNVASGERFRTWIEAGEESSGEVRVHAGERSPFRTGDVISILCFGFPHDGQAIHHTARLVTLGEGNTIIAIAEGKAEQPAFIDVV